MRLVCRKRNGKNPIEPIFGNVRKLPGIAKLALEIARRSDNGDNLDDANSELDPETIEIIESAIESETKIIRR